MWEQSDIKFAAFDLDGTLVDKRGELFDQVEDGIKLLCLQNIKPIIVTGRPVDSFLSLEFSDSFLKMFSEKVICSDGNQFFDVKKNTIVTHKKLDREIYDSVINLFGDSVNIVIEMNGVHYAQNRAASLKYSKLYGVKREFIKDLDNLLCKEEISEIIIFPVNEKISIQTFAGFDCEVTSLNYFDAIRLSPYGICKAIGLSQLFQQTYGRDLIDNVIAFGDGRNDCNLLKKCKIGVAVQDSHMEAISSANMVLTEPLGIFLLNAFSNYKKIER